MVGVLMGSGSLRRTLLAWYDERGRDLPWRRSPSPYATLVSEFMLQQTRVATVIPHFLSFMERFPTLPDLASADRDDVLRLWQGLGYYRRAGHLHEAARQAMMRHGGVPSGTDALIALSGIGPYLAGAIASIGYGRPVAAVDGNVRRVLARLFDRDLGDRATARCASAILSRERPGDWNQALMDLGATVCTPRAPRCPQCPLQGSCRAYRRGTVSLRPATRVRRPPRLLWRPTLFCTSGRGSGLRVLVERLPEDGPLGGLWAFPGETVAAAPERLRSTDDTPRHVLDRLAGRIGLAGLSIVSMPCMEYRHMFTHRTWRVTVHRARVSAGLNRPPQRERGEFRWATRAGLRDLPMPHAFRPIRNAWLEEGQNDLGVAP